MFKIFDLLLKCDELGAPYFIETLDWMSFKNKYEQHVNSLRNILVLDRLSRDFDQIKNKLDKHVASLVRKDLMKISSDRVANLYKERKEMIRRYSDELDDTIFFVEIPEPFLPPIEIIPSMDDIDDQMIMNAHNELNQLICDVLLESYTK